MSDAVEAPTLADGVDYRGAPDPQRRPRLGRKFIGLCFFAGLIAAIAASSIEVNYFSIEPGNTFETEEFVTVDGTEAFTSEGEVSFVTVTQRRLTPITWVISSLRDSDFIFHEDEILGDQTIDEQREENTLLMLTSQSNAVASALNELGYETAVPAGAVIIDVVEGGSLDGLLARNDVISSVDGEEITEVGHSLTSSPRSMRAPSKSSPPDREPNLARSRLKSPMTREASSESQLLKTPTAKAMARSLAR